MPMPMKLRVTVRCIQPPHPGGKVAHAVRRRARQGLEAGFPPTVDGAAQPHDEVAVPQPLELVCQLQRHRLRTSPLAVRTRCGTHRVAHGPRTLPRRRTGEHPGTR